MKVQAESVRETYNYSMTEEELGREKGHSGYGPTLPHKGPAVLEDERQKCAGPL